MQEKDKQRNPWKRAHNKLRLCWDENKQQKDFLRFTGQSTKTLITLFEYEAFRITIQRLVDFIQQLIVRA
jgi:hypothetical protein